jgi:zinc transport system permease protein
MMELLSYPFFIRALVVSVLISVSCGIVGTYIVSRRLVFLGGSISHSSFGGIGIGYYLGFNPLLGAAAFAILTAFAIEGISRRTEMRQDSVIGILWSFGMAVGVIFIFMTPGYSPNLISFLFGNLLTVSLFDIIAVSVVTLLVVAVFALFFRIILYIAFDEEYAITQGLPVQAVNYLMLGLIAITIVISIRAVGIILVISLLTIPQVTAGLLTGNFRRLTGYSICFAVIASVGGLFISYFLEIPSGASIIFTAVIVFIVVRMLRKGAITRRRARNC